MGKASTAKRLRREQGEQQPAKTTGKAWCDHCLEVLHGTDLSEPADAIRQAYEEMRSGFGLDRPYSHAETMEWLDGEVSAIMASLRSSGERYHYECELESKAERHGFAHHDPEGYAEHYSEPPPEWTDQELQDWHEILDRKGA